MKVFVSATRLNRPALFSLGVGVLAAACAPAPKAERARKEIRLKHMPAIAVMIRRDIETHREAVVKAAEKLTPGFGVDKAHREQEMRAALKYLRKPPKGIEALFASPMSFMAAVDRDGVVIARDSEPDRMKGLNFAKDIPYVAQALERGVSGSGVVELQAASSEKVRPVNWVFIAPAMNHKDVVGAVVIGIPLWRLAQRISKQLQVENTANSSMVVWAYIYRGSEIFHFGTPPDLDKLVPNDAARKNGLAKSPGGFTDQVSQYGRWYGYGVMPISDLGEDSGVILFCSDPL